MMMKKVALLIFFCISVSSRFFAQVEVFANPDTVDFGTSTYSANIYVSNFDLIIGAQFTVVWDSTILSVKEISDVVEFISPDDHFGFEEASSGILRFAWLDNSLTGFNLPDTSILFKVEFDVIGNANQSTPIAFKDIPTAREVYDTTFEIVSSNFTDGALFIDGGQTVSSIKENKEALDILSLQPNPTQGQNPQLSFFLKDSDTLTLRIVSINGQELKTYTDFYPGGKHQVPLNLQDFPQSGVYIIRMESSRFYATQKLIVQQ